MSSEIPKELERRDPIQLMSSFLEVSLQYFPHHIQPRLTGFFQFLQDHPGLRDLFLLAMYQGVYGIQKKVHEEEAASSSSAPHASSLSSATFQMMSAPDNYRSQSEYVHVHVRTYSHVYVCVCSFKLSLCIAIFQCIILLDALYFPPSLLFHCFLFYFLCFYLFR